MTTYKPGDVTIPDEGIIINVTAEYIAFARAQERGECAVAIAIRAAGTRDKGGLRYRAPKVDRDIIIFTDTEHDLRLTFTAPPAVRKCVDAIDAGKSVRPFSTSLHYKEAVYVRSAKHADPMTYVNQGGRVARAASREANRGTGRRPVYVAEA